MSLNDHRNPNGTFDGVGIMVELSGLSRAEIVWTYARIKTLLGEGKSRDEAKAIVKEEAKCKPWLES